MTANVTAVVVTLGQSPLLVTALEALEREGLPIVLVHQGDSVDLELAPHPSVELVRLPSNLGFAGGNNVGIQKTETELVALVNDDAVVEPGWAEHLVAALEADTNLAAAQGVNLSLDRPDILDGCGIGWNRRLQAIQIGHGEPRRLGTRDDARAVRRFGHGGGLSTNGARCHRP